MTPGVWDYAQQAKADSMLNTPPTYSLYIAGLVFKWVKEQGGLSAMAERNERKAKKAVRRDRWLRLLWEPGGSVVSLMDERAVCPGQSGFGWRVFSRERPRPA